MNLVGLHSIEVLVPSKKNLPICACGLISKGFSQYASQILNLELFVAEKAERSSSCEEDSHSQGRACTSNEQEDQKTNTQRKHCAHLTNVPKTK